MAREIPRRGRLTYWRCEVCERDFSSRATAERCEQEPLADLPLVAGTRIRFINRATNEEREGRIVSATQFCWNGHESSEGWTAHRRAYVVRWSGVPYDIVIDPEEVLMPVEQT